MVATIKTVNDIVNLTKKETQETISEFKDIQVVRTDIENLVKYLNEAKRLLVPEGSRYIAELNQLGQFGLKLCNNCEVRALDAFKGLRAIKSVALSIEKRLFKAREPASNRLAQEEKWAIALSSNLSKIFKNALENINLIRGAFSGLKIERLRKYSESQKKLDMARINNGIVVGEKAMKNLAFAMTAVQKLKEIDAYMLKLEQRL